MERFTFILRGRPASSVGFSLVDSIPNLLSEFFHTLDLLRQPKSTRVINFTVQVCLVAVGSWFRAACLRQTKPTQDINLNAPDSLWGIEARRLENHRNTFGSIISNNVQKASEADFT
jgi:hypothetical protein